MGHDDADDDRDVGEVDDHDVDDDGAFGFDVNNDHGGDVDVGCADVHDANGYDGGDGAGDDNDVGHLMVFMMVMLLMI